MTNDDKYEGCNPYCGLTFDQVQAASPDLTGLYYYQPDPRTRIYCKGAQQLQMIKQNYTNYLKRKTKWDDQKIIIDPPYLPM